MNQPGLHDVEAVAATAVYAHTLGYVDRTQTLAVGQSAVSAVA